jgi:hypothetical protein
VGLGWLPRLLAVGGWEDEGEMEDLVEKHRRGDRVPYATVYLSRVFATTAGAQSFGSVGTSENEIQQEASQTQPFLMLSFRKGLLSAVRE